MSYSADKHWPCEWSAVLKAKQRAFLKAPHCKILEHGYNRAKGVESAAQVQICACPGLVSLGRFQVHTQCRGGLVVVYGNIRWTEMQRGSKVVPGGKVSSPERIKAKNPKQQAAQSIRSSYITGGLAHTLPSVDRMRGVIGRRLSPDLGLRRLKPLRAKSTRGHPLSGSGKPRDRCRCRTAAK